ncbi:MAG: hypothetical protein HDKAJFGB_02529 [Anaerolineae bacterium]|nr:hypothetical protein [Anaerolineae bacterium]MDL1895038.1 hypothetical protein [Anaerolineae bacterium CFX7]RIK32810.1 MAG: hypothetical protein DCC52_04760 [Chloroflexota bacterium]
MSAETITTVIRRAVAEPEFRTTLFQNPAAALSGYDLSNEERAALSNLTAENFDALSGELETRLSKSDLGIGIEMDATRKIGISNTSGTGGKS